MTTLIFDLDGTLIDTASILLPAFRAAIRCFPEFPQPADSVLLGTFGLSDHDVWQLLMPGGTPEQHEKALKLTEAYVKNGLFETNVLMEGAFEVIETLHRRGYTLTTASNCGEAYLANVLDSQGLRPYFTRPLCLGSVRGVCKADILSEHFRHFPKADAWMIGDRKTDIEAAMAHDIPSIGCDFGFAAEGELEHATKVIHHIRELLDLFPA